MHSYWKENQQAIQKKADCSLILGYLTDPSPLKINTELYQIANCEAIDIQSCITQYLDPGRCQIALLREWSVTIVRKSCTYIVIPEFFVLEAMSSNLRDDGDVNLLEARTTLPGR